MSPAETAKALYQHGTARAGAASKASYSVLQAFRGLAAAGVVGFHVNRSIFGLEKYWPDKPFGNFLEIGHAGVEFFFVLSGFIILTAHRQDIGRPGLLRTYAWKRFLRIYPIYWVVLAVVTPAYLVNPAFGTGQEASLAAIVNSALLFRVLPSTAQVLGVSWTLFHEILFYLAFGLLIWNKRAGIAALTLWMIASLVPLAAGQAVPPLLAFYLSPLHLLFLMGMAVAAIIHRGRVPLPWFCLALGTVVFAAAGAADLRSDITEATGLSLLYGLGSALMIAGSVELERAGRLSVAKPLVALGDASYSIYLIHFPVLSVMAKLFMKLASVGLELPPMLAFALLLAGGIGSGLLLHAAVEKRLLALGRRRPRQPDPARVTSS